MIELRDNQLIFTFPEVHPEARLTVEFQRTLRIPDDNREYHLPPGFGEFPLLHVDDYVKTLPSSWEKRGGVFLPMYQAEALWINFESDYPFAVKIAAGKVDAVTGNSWTDDLENPPQNYLVVPDQPWLDGFSVSKGKIRQFVAMPLGEGYTAEEQITGKAEHGGMQIIAYPMKKSIFNELHSGEIELLRNELMCEVSGSIVPDMGIAPGGLMHQEIYEDEYGLNTWDTDAHSRCFVHIANSLTYHIITGSPAPTKPPTAAQYTDAGLPWFDYYDAELKSLEGSGKLAGLDSVAAKGIKKGEKPLPENVPIHPDNIKKICQKSIYVREGNF
jgi:hypothetical protein